MGIGPHTQGRPIVLDRSCTGHHPSVEQSLVSCFETFWLTHLVGNLRSSFQEDIEAVRYFHTPAAHKTIGRTVGLELTVDGFDAADRCNALQVQV